MLRKTLIAAAAAAVVTAGGVAVGTTPAAAGSVETVNPAHVIQVHKRGAHRHRHGPRRHLQSRLRRSCEPVFKRVRWRDRWGYVHVKRVFVGTRCFHRRGHHRHHGNNFSLQFSF